MVDASTLCICNEFCVSFCCVIVYAGVDIVYNMSTEDKGIPCHAI